MSTSTLQNKTVKEEKFVISIYILMFNINIRVYKLNIYAHVSYIIVAGTFYYIKLNVSNKYQFKVLKK